MISEINRTGDEQMKVKTERRNSLRTTLKHKDTEIREEKLEIAARVKSSTFGIYQ